MKQFVKALPKEEECFKYLCKKCPGLSDAKLKEDIFVGPDNRKLLSDDLFQTTMKTVERGAWNAFKEIIAKYLGNYKDPNYKQIVEKVLENFKALGCAMSLRRTVAP
jgi:predicted Zn-dependent protease